MYYPDEVYIGLFFCFCFLDLKVFEEVTFYILAALPQGEVAPLCVSLVVLGGFLPRYQGNPFKDFRHIPH